MLLCIFCLSLSIEKQLNKKMIKPIKHLRGRRVYLKDSDSFAPAVIVDSYRNDKTNEAHVIVSFDGIQKEMKAKGLVFEKYDSWDQYKDNQKLCPYGRI